MAIAREKSVNRLRKRELPVGRAIWETAAGLISAFSLSEQNQN